MVSALDLKIAAARKRVDAARAACNSKAQYVTRAEAKALLRRNNFNGTIYACKFCSYFHFSSFNKKKFKQAELEIRQALHTLENLTSESKTHA